MLVQHGTLGEGTLAACGDSATLQIAEVTSRIPARVTAARFLDASRGLRAVEVLGYNGPPSLFSDGVAVRPPNGVPISQHTKRPTVLSVVVATSCSPNVASGRAKADLVAHKVELTVVAGGETRTQTLPTGLDICVSKVAPGQCP